MKFTKILIGILLSIQSVLAFGNETAIWCPPGWGPINGKCVLLAVENGQPIMLYAIIFIAIAWLYIKSKKN